MTLTPEEVEEWRQESLKELHLTSEEETLYSSMSSYDTILDRVHCVNEHLFQMICTYPTTVLDKELYFDLMQASHNLSCIYQKIGQIAQAKFEALCGTREERAELSKQIESLKETVTKLQEQVEKV